jgi:hypothetical protein
LKLGRMDDGVLWDVPVLGWGGELVRPLSVPSLRAAALLMAREIAAELRMLDSLNKAMRRPKRFK